MGCNNNRVNDLVVKETFSTILKEIITNKKEIKKDVETALKTVLTTCRTEINDIEELIKSKEKVERERSKLLDLCLKEIITDEEYKNKSIELNEKISKYDVEIREQEEKRKIRENIDDIIDNVRKIIDNILNLKEFSKNICKELLDRVVVHNNKKFDFYLKGYEDPFNFDYKGNILYAQH